MFFSKLKYIAIRSQMLNFSNKIKHLENNESKRVSLDSLLFLIHFSNNLTKSST